MEMMAAQKREMDEQHNRYMQSIRDRDAAIERERQNKIDEQIRATYQPK